MSKLAPMRYKDYTWPHNPRVYAIEYERALVAHKVPFGRYCLQDLGPAQRILRGDGEFVGSGAYAEFKKLASVFYGEGPGVLVHPVWQSASAYFASLSLRQEPRPDYVAYTFSFWESFEGYYSTTPTALPAEAEKKTEAAAQNGVWHTVARGETLWGIAARYGQSLTELIALNPQIKNPNLILVGERVRVR